MGVNISLEGLGDLLDAVDQMLPEPEKTLEAALVAGAQPVYEEAKKTSAFSDRTGKLRKSIKVGKVKGAGGSKYITVEADDPIARPVEEGHGGPHPAPPHPFLRPAFEAKKEEATGEIKRVLKEALR